MYVFILFLIDIQVSKQWRPWSDAADLGLHCLPMSHKRDAKLIWVKKLASLQMKRTAKTLITLGWCPGSSESSLCAQVISIFVLLRLIHIYVHIYTYIKVSFNILNKKETLHTFFHTFQLRNIIFRYCYVFCHLADIIHVLANSLICFRFPPTATCKELSHLD